MKTTNTVRAVKGPRPTKTKQLLLSVTVLLSMIIFPINLANLQIKLINYEINILFFKNSIFANCVDN